MPLSTLSLSKKKTLKTSLRVTSYVVLLNLATNAVHAMHILQNYHLLKLNRALLCKRITRQLSLCIKNINLETDVICQNHLGFKYRPRYGTCTLNSARSEGIEIKLWHSRLTNCFCTRNRNPRTNGASISAINTSWRYTLFMW